MSGTWAFRRLIALVVVLATFGAPALVSNSAFGDQITDKRAQARRVADELDVLQEKAEILAEQYNDAQLALSSVDAKVDAAAAEVSQTQSDLSKRRDDLASYAVSSYVLGGSTNSTALILSADSGNDVGQRQGYAKATLGDKADLIDRVRTAKAKSEADIATLKKARTAAAKARDGLEAKRKAAQSAVDEQQQIVSRVTGELATLVKAEQDRRAAAAAKAAAVAARKARAVQASLPVQRPSATDSPSPSSPISPPVADPPVGHGAQAAIAAARSVLGVRYTWGGASPSTGFDCSGLVMWSWQHGGVSLPHSSAAMNGSTRHIPLSSLQPGDLIFYGSPVHHVALYIGGQQIIHAPHTGSYVQVASMYYWSDIAGAGRV